MKTINLLPKIRQSEIRLADHFRTIYLFCGISSATLLLVVVALLGTRLYLTTESTKLSGEIEVLKTAVNKQENAELKAKIAGVNNKILDFKNLADATPAWSKVFLAFSKLVPEDVGINNFSVEIEKRKVEISGFAKSREAVIQLYDNLKADTENFVDVNYPLENISKPKDVTFQFTFYMKPEILKQ